MNILIIINLNNKNKNKHKFKSESEIHNRNNQSIINRVLNFGRQIEEQTVNSNQLTK